MNQEIAKNWRKAMKTYIRKGIYRTKSPIIHKMLAKRWMKKKQYKKAVYHWEKAYENQKNKFSTNDYMQFVNALYFCANKEKTIQMLKQALNQYQTNEKFTFLLTDFLFKQKRWKEVTPYLEHLYKQNNPSVTVYTHLIQAYVEQRLYDKANTVLQKGIRKYPNEVFFKDGSAYRSILDNHYANRAIRNKEWNEAINHLNNSLDNMSDQMMAFENQMHMGMLYQIMGENHLAQTVYNSIYKYHSHETSDSKEDYHKIILYDNAESRIEFYKKTKAVNKVVVTFDSLYMTWKQPAFGMKFLQKQDVDIIAVRKRKKGSSQQDLTQNDFVKSVEKLVSGYQDKVAYGHSLGGYTALYYASLINCRILSLAPRLSIHPIYGLKSKAGRKFYHQESQTYNEQIAPIIVYDPKDKMDYTYVHHEVLKAFPNAHLVQIPYSGHGMARHLLRMGVLKEYILKVIDNEIPKYNRRLKANSANYFWVLGRKCLVRNKLKWAQNLSEQAVQLTPTNSHAVKIKIDVLKKMKRYEDALDYAKETLEIKPKNKHIRLMLIDIYIEMEEFKAAEYEISQSIKIFKNTAKLNQRREKVHKLIHDQKEPSLIS